MDQQAQMKFLHRDYPCKIPPTLQWVLQSSETLANMTVEAAMKLNPNRL